MMKHNKKGKPEGYTLGHKASLLCIINKPEQLLMAAGVTSKDSSSQNLSVYMNPLDLCLT